MEIKCFTDGSFYRRDSKEFAGYSVYFPDGIIINEEKIDQIYKKFIHSPITNQRAELYAIYKAIYIVTKNLEFNKLTIYTDSKYCVKSFTEWYKKWEKNNWKSSSGVDVKNQDIIKPIINNIKKYKNKIDFIHVYGHDDNEEDYFAICNGLADAYAGKASGHYSELEAEKKIKKYLYLKNNLKNI
jgi:ribonuclease HI